MPLFTTPRAFSLNNLFVPPSLGQHASSDGIAYPQMPFTVGSPPLPPHASHPALPHLTLLVFEAVLEVVCVSLPGYIVARQGMFTAEMQKFTANLNLALFTPCLSMFRWLQNLLLLMLKNSLHQTRLAALCRQADRTRRYSCNLHSPDDRILLMLSRRFETLWLL